MRSLIMEDFVNFKLAQKLKDKEFREECLCHYVGEDLYYNIESPIANNQLWFSHNKFDNIWHRDNHDAPTISQALKWLRDEKGIHVGIMLGEFSDWVYEVSRIYGNVFCEAEDNFKSYEQAALAGIEYVLDNLI